MPPDGGYMGPPHLTRGNLMTQLWNLMTQPFGSNSMLAVYLDCQVSEESEEFPMYVCWAHFPNNGLDSAWCHPPSKTYLTYVQEYRGLSHRSYLPSQMLVISPHYSQLGQGCLFPCPTFTSSLRALLLRKKSNEEVKADRVKANIPKNTKLSEETEQTLRLVEDI